jgi:hypothetical protein
VRVAARALGLGLALAAASAGAAPIPRVDERPALGRHLAQLCVATSAAPPSCGPAQVDRRANGTASVRVDDVVYHLKLNSSQVEVVVMHNVVQIDEFTVPYTWVGSTLQFDDDDRHSRYEVRFFEAKH